jgi:hypothetical protein
MNRMLQSSYFMDYVQSRMMIALPEAAALYDASTAAVTSALATTMAASSVDDPVTAKRLAEDDEATLEADAAPMPRKPKQKKARRI